MINVILNVIIIPFQMIISRSCMYLVRISRNCITVSNINISTNAIIKGKAGDLYHGITNNRLYILLRN